MIETKGVCVCVAGGGGLGEPREGGVKATDGIALLCLWMASILIYLLKQNTWAPSWTYSLPALSSNELQFIFYPILDIFLVHLIFVLFSLIHHLWLWSDLRMFPVYKYSPVQLKDSVLRRFCHGDIMECSYTNLDGRTYYCNCLCYTSIGLAVR